MARPKSVKKNVEEAKKIAPKDLNLEEIAHLSDDEIKQLKLTPEQLELIAGIKKEIADEKAILAQPLHLAENAREHLQKYVPQMTVHAATTMPEMLDGLFNKPFSQCTAKQKAMRTTLLMSLIV